MILRDRTIVSPPFGAANGIPHVGYSYGSFHGHGCIPKGMGFTYGKFQLEMDDDWGYPIYGNLHIDCPVKASKALRFEEKPREGSLRQRWKNAPIGKFAHGLEERFGK